MHRFVWLALASALLPAAGATAPPFAAQVKSDIAKWRKVIQEVGIKAD